MHVYFARSAKKFTHLSLKLPPWNDNLQWSIAALIAQSLSKIPLSLFNPWEGDDIIEFGQLLKFINLLVLELSPVFCEKLGLLLLLSFTFTFLFDDIHLFKGNMNLELILAFFSIRLSFSCTLCVKLLNAGMKGFPVFIEGNLTKNFTTLLLINDTNLDGFLKY